MGVLIDAHKLPAVECAADRISPCCCRRLQGVGVSSCVVSVELSHYQDVPRDIEERIEVRSEAWDR